MEQQFYGFSNQSDLEAYDDNGQIIELDSPPAKVKKITQGQNVAAIP